MLSTLFFLDSISTSFEDVLGPTQVKYCFWKIRGEMWGLVVMSDG
jgi:hypothetical protein